MAGLAGRSFVRRFLVRSIALRRHTAFAAGLLFALAVILAAGEFYLSRFPPRDLQPYLGDASPLAGPFINDERLIVRYRTWDDFQADYSARLQLYQPLLAAETRPPIWAFFGNSFVQAPGMLGDTARDRVANRTVFYLGRNEPLSVRLAQIDLLLEQGIIPERIFFVILPIEVYALALHSLDRIYVNDSGAITWQPTMPPGVAGSVARESRLALSAWLRTNFHRSVPGFRLSHTVRPLKDSMLADMKRILTSLRDITRARGVPVTMVLVPNFEQIAQGASCGLLDQLGELSRARGFDVCDTRDAFLAYPAGRRGELFIPDKHFSPVGNQILLDKLLAHLRAIGAEPETVFARGPRP